MRLDKFEGDLFWDAADTENSVDSPDDHMDHFGSGDVVKFEAAKRVSDMWGAINLSGDVAYFSTLTEAEEYANKETV